MYAEVFADDVASTVTVVATNVYYPLAGSTVFGSKYFNGNVMVARPTFATSPRLQLGNEGAGIYAVDLAISFTGALNTTYHVAVHKNTSKLPDMSIERKIGTGGDVGAAAIAGLVVLKNTTDYIDFRVNADTTNVQMTVNHFCLRALRLTTSTALSTLGV